MGKKNTSARGCYERATGREVPRGYEIHHIDGNNDHDSIENLVALPRFLHKAYHSKYPGPPPDFRLMAVNEPGNGYSGWWVSMLSGFFDVYIQCIPWVNYREFLRGNLPRTCSAGVTYDNN